MSENFGELGSAKNMPDHAERIGEQRVVFGIEAPTETVVESGDTPIVAIKPAETSVMAGTIDIGPHTAAILATGTVIQQEIASLARIVNLEKRSEFLAISQEMHKYLSGEMPAQ